MLRLACTALLQTSTPDWLLSMLLWQLQAADAKPLLLPVALKSLVELVVDAQVLVSVRDQPAEPKFLLLILAAETASADAMESVARAVLAVSSERFSRASRVAM